MHAITTLKLWWSVMQWSSHFTKLYLKALETHNNWNYIIVHYLLIYIEYVDMYEVSWIEI